jgi:hypothetical protein
MVRRPHAVCGLGRQQQDREEFDRSLPGSAVSAQKISSCVVGIREQRCLHDLGFEVPINWNLDGLLWQAYRKK